MAAYEIKLTAFLDILGFGLLVEKSAGDPTLTQTIFDFLTSINPDKVHTEAFVQLNHDHIPPEELAEVIEAQKLMAQAIQMEWPIDVAYFSDSLVFSAANSNSCYMVLELICSLMVRIWNDYGLLVRGGIAIDKLIHIKNGPIFGPAMNEAYRLESKEAKHPRAIIEPGAFNRLKKVDLYPKMKKLFSDDGDYQSITLASAFDHLIHTSTLGLGPGIREKYIAALLAAPERLSAMVDEFPADDEKVKPKYFWIKERIDALAEKVRLSHSPSADQ